MEVAVERDSFDRTEVGHIELAVDQIEFEVARIVTGVDRIDFGAEIEYIEFEVVVDHIETVVVQIEVVVVHIEAEVVHTEAVVVMRLIRFDSYHYQHTCHLQADRFAAGVENFHKHFDLKDLPAVHTQATANLKFVMSTCFSIQ